MDPKIKNTRMFIFLLGMLTGLIILFFTSCSAYMVTVKNQFPVEDGMAFYSITDSTITNEQGNRFYLYESDTLLFEGSNVWLHRDGTIKRIEQ